MKFTNLNKQLSKQPLQRKPQKRDRKKLILRVLAVLVILFVVIYLPVRGAYNSGKAMVASARAVSDAAKQENLDLIRQHLKETKKANDDLNRSLFFMSWAGWIPLVGGYYSDIQKFARASAHELEAANMIADSLEPYKNEIGFTGTPTAGQDRIAQMAKVLEKVVPQLDKFAPEMKKASEEVDDIDPNKYPETFGKYAVRSRVASAKELIMGAHFAVTEARPALEIAPAALGVPTAKNYLIIFQNDKELRPTGGFMTAYSFMKLDKGHINSSVSDDIYRLDERLLQVCQNRVCALTPPAPLVKYLPEADGRQRTAWSMRDSNISPDVATSLKDFERMYNYLPGMEKFDGIVLIDTHVVEEMIKITGPIEVLGTTYSAETDKRCNCPNVIYELENYAQRIEAGEADRKAILGNLMQQLLARFLGSSTDRLPEMMTTGVKLANEKHILFYMHDQKTQDALADLNWTGQIKNTEGDYFHINDSNFAGGKSNLYVTQDVLLEINEKDGKNMHKLTINYSNPQAYNTWLNNINRNYFRVYVPKGSKLTFSKGSSVPVGTLEDLGKTVFDGFIQIRPQNSIQVVLEYEVPIALSGKEYPLLIQRQPGTKDFNYEIKVNGKSKEKFQLNTDKELKLSI